MEEALNNGIVFLGENNQLMTTSMKVAEVFGKEHKHVLRDIDKVVCSDEFRQSNFGPQLRIRELCTGGKIESRYFTLTRDGFTFLAMGYTGQKAARFKELYIKTFNEMEARLRKGEDLPTVATGEVARLREELTLLRKEVGLMRELESVRYQRSRLDGTEPYGLPSLSASSCETPIEEVEEGEMEELDRFARLFFKEEDNVGFAVSMREIAITWLQFHHIPVNTRTLHIHQRNVRTLLLEWCRRNEVIVNPPELPCSASDRKTGSIRTLAYASLFDGENLHSKRTRRKKCQRCLFFYPPGTPLPAMGDPMPPSGKRSGLMPRKLV